MIDHERALTYLDAIKCTTREEAEEFVRKATAQVGGDPEIQRANAVYCAYYYGTEAGEKATYVFKMTRQEAIKKFSREKSL